MKTELASNEYLQMLPAVEMPKELTENVPDVLGSVTEYKKDFRVSFFCLESF